VGVVDVVVNIVALALLQQFEGASHRTLPVPLAFGNRDGAPLLVRVIYRA
jgi:hypothetical protein